MVKRHLILSAVCAVSIATVSAQLPSATPGAPVVPINVTPAAATAPEAPGPIEPLIQPLAPSIPESAPQPAATGTNAAPVTLTATNLGATSNRTLNEFQGDDIGQVLRMLARQAKINIVVSDKVDGAGAPMKVTMRLEDKTPVEAIKIIVTSKGLIMDVIDGVYYVKTKEEKEAEPTESASFTLSYGAADKIVGLLATQLQSKIAPQFDPRTNTIFYREVGSNMANIKLFLATIDKPTSQVMIEARLVEVTANPKQSYGINWAGVVGGAASAQTFRYGGSFSNAVAAPLGALVNPTNAAGTNSLGSAQVDPTKGTASVSDFVRSANSGTFLNALAGQFAILSIPQMSATLRLLNEDSDAEFLANPRVVTANNEEATIKITRNQPVPQLNFNEQTATAVFGGFQDKEFGNTLKVKPSINKDDFVTLNVQPEISNKVGDSTFTFAGATVASPIIDKRVLNSTVLIKSGDTLAIGGLLQDETTKGRTKVPVMGDIPVLGYLFQERLNVRTKRNLLVFVTPTLIKQGYGTGLEDQVTGITHSSEEYADPNGWRNNAKGAVRIVPTSNRQNAADYPKPGVAPAPAKLKYKVSAISRER